MVIGPKPDGSGITGYMGHPAFLNNGSPVFLKTEGDFYAGGVGLFVIQEQAQRISVQDVLLEG